MEFWNLLKISSFKNMCKKYGFKYEINETNVVIRTGVSSWIITMGKNYGTIELFHSNHMWKKQKRKKEDIPDYHFQKRYSLKYKGDVIVNNNILIDIIKYIKNHDKNKYEKDFKRFEKRNRRLDYLFSQI